MHSAAEIKQTIKTEAFALGFLLCGVTSLDPPESYPIFEDWLRADSHGDMHYLAREDTRRKRANPVLLMPEAKSILCFAYPCPPLVSKTNPDENAPLVAAYAALDDYHKLIPALLDQCLNQVSQQTDTAMQWKIFTDSAPILEHDLAHRAGLGWIGKNSLLIHPQFGSNFLLAEVMVDLELETDAPFAADFCGTCQRCIQACPPQCINDNRTIDARRCISYSTIEHKNFIPNDLVSEIGSHLFGCDICQQVCPWNQKTQLLVPPASFINTHIPTTFEEIIASLSLDDVGYQDRFGYSPFLRIKRRGYLRNVCIVLGNSLSLATIPALNRFQQEELDPLLLEYANWAISKITRGSAK